VETRKPADFLINWFLIPVFLLFFALVGFAFRYSWTVLKGEKGRPTIIVEYLPPKNLSLEEAALLLGRRGSLPIAKILELAVENRVRLSETEKGEWSLTRVSDEVDKGSNEALRALVGMVPQIGIATPLPKHDAQLSRRMTAYFAAVALTVKRRFMLKVPFTTRVLVSIAAMLLSVLVLTLAVTSMTNRYGSGLVIAAMFLGPALTVTCFVLMNRTPLNREGAQYRDHLTGLKLFIAFTE
jgi:hypothetical protein